ncbi:aspartyl protease family protein At5g10770-like [Phoenix dactylifera]|uniref:Aspartyl protease family protein At5g10770-like n=1 Tax=Phoenix dactylifera TaxID=42345 RepID=A0A8B8ZXS7_PHODC|nr:aspartyl protease family protein At5g10770-like [Phoenix dactylifera]
MALLHSSLCSCCAFFLLAFTFLQAPRVYGRETENRYVVGVRSLLPSSVCSSPRDSNPSMMRVVHRHGPCSPLSPSRKPADVKLLNQDQDRVNWLQRQISIASNGTRASLSATIPANSGGSIGTGNYVVKVGFGTPKNDFTVIFDTGSDITWIQCKPCSGRNCYPQQDPLFDPSQSSTYSNISCSSPSCKKLDSRNCSAGSRCRYKIEYGDKSQSKGFFGSDTLTLTPSDVLPNFLFGCGDQSKGLFGRAAGLLGLGRRPVSLVSQSSPKYGGVFSYCIPSTSSKPGYLTLGSRRLSNVQFTPLRTFSNLPSFYFLDLVAIKVGGKQLPISSKVFSTAGTVLDSGTVISRLPPSAYAALQSAFRKQMTRYKMVPALSILDTCYDFTGYDTVSVPTVALMFGGGTTLNVDFSGILYVPNVSQACLAFAPNGDAKDFGIIGNAQQKRFNVVYDIANRRIGFGANGCN